jgi:hypothetical protein
MVGKFDDGVGEKIPQWIKANGGQFSRDVNPRVTHLIATKQAYKDNGPLGMVHPDMCYRIKLMSHSSICEAAWDCQDRHIRLARGLVASGDSET